MRPRIFIIWLSIIFILIPTAGSAIQLDMVSKYKSQFGFIAISDYDFLLEHKDSIANSYLSKDDNDGYYITKLMTVYAYAERSNYRMAFMVINGEMFQKASTTNDYFGLAMSAMAEAEAYVKLGRYHTANASFLEAKSLLKHTSNSVIKEILDFLTYYTFPTDSPNFRNVLDYVEDIDDKDLMTMPLYQMISMRMMRAKSNIYVNNYAKAREDLDIVTSFLGRVCNDLEISIMLLQGFYYESTGKNQLALQVYQSIYDEKQDIFFAKKIADQYAILGENQKAFETYKAIYETYEETNLERHDSEINDVITRYKAAQLLKNNAKAKTKSLRIHIAEAVSAMILVIFLVISSQRKNKKWKTSRIKMEKAQRDSEEAIRRKSAYLSSMSHEIRTPLNSIIGFSSLLTSDEMVLDEETKLHAQEVISSNTKMMLKLINDIPDYQQHSEVRKQTYTTLNANVLCNNILSIIIKSYSPKVEMSFRTHLKDLEIETDETSLSQILINLLVNAIKFTNLGSIIIGLELKDNNTALFSVTDTGCGIPFDKRKTIFERFEKAQESDHGTGLGLYICSLLIKELGGKIWVDPKYSKGARFLFTHPINKVQR